MPLATLIDYTAYAMLALTVFLISFKVLDLWVPRLTGLAHPDTFPRAALTAHVLTLERGLTLLAVIASTAPFIGLMGTVLHIMDALAQVSSSLDTALISGPIATALNATLVGLASAVPAAASHALFVRRIQVLECLNLAKPADAAPANQAGLK